MPFAALQVAVSFHGMRRRSRLFRVVTLAWATLQLAAPALASIADGQLSVNDVFRNTTHIEATTSSSCPVVHSPDCGLCRYLSTSPANDVSAPAFDWTVTASGALVQTESAGASSLCIALPFGRAPPTV